MLLSIALPDHDLLAVRDNALAFLAHAGERRVELVRVINSTSEEGRDVNCDDPVPLDGIVNLPNGCLEAGEARIAVRPELGQCGSVRTIIVSVAAELVSNLCSRRCVQIGPAWLVEQLDECVLVGADLFGEGFSEALSYSAPTAEAHWSTLCRSRKNVSRSSASLRLSTASRTAGSRPGSASSACPWTSA